MNVFADKEGNEPKTQGTMKFEINSESSSSFLFEIFHNHAV